MLGSLAQFEASPELQQVDLGAAAGFSLAMLLIILPLLVLMIVELWKVFDKAGKPGWAAIVPIYNTWVLAEVGGKPGWWGLVAALAGVIPGIGWLISFALFIVISIGVSKNFGKEPIFSALLLLLPPVGYGVLAFTPAKYKKAATS